ncbi:MAG: hypothetical protein JWM11_799 [Planctomycetaceae bacterium]|nr:hypothetical protein [Planctomycetaceae bacterium]
MTRSRRFSLACILTILITCATLWMSRPGMETGLATFGGSQRILAADAEQRWYRGNLHTHSLWSDGDDYPEMIALWYRERNYDFLCYTDHNVLQRSERWIDVEKSAGHRAAYDKLKLLFPLNWVQERTTNGRLEVRLKTFGELSERFDEGGKFLLIQGEEITDKFQKKPVHMNATNLQEQIPPHGGNSVYEVIQNNTNAVIAQRERTGKPIFVHLNHPNFVWGITAEDLARVRGENFFEVYNGHIGVNNAGDSIHASTERLWDIILSKRLSELDLPLMYGLATDDGHNYHHIPSRKSEPGRGWVMVLARDLTPKALIESLEQGLFYASSGVFLERVVSDASGLELEIRAEPDVEYTVEFVGTRLGFDPTSTPVLDKNGNELDVTRQYSADIGKVLAKAVLNQSKGSKVSYHFQGNELYVRARITSSKQHPNPSKVGDFQQAWIQPALGPAAKR